MKTIKKTLLIFALLGVMNSANADDMSDYEWRKTIRVDSSMCTTKEFLSEFIQAKVEGNQARWQAYITNGLCAISTPDMKIKVVSGNWNKAEIRIYAGKKPVVMWVNSSAVMK